MISCNKWQKEKCIWTSFAASAVCGFTACLQRAWTQPPSARPSRRLLWSCWDPEPQRRHCARSWRSEVRLKQQQTLQVLCSIDSFSFFFLTERKTFNTLKRSPCGILQSFKHISLFLSTISVVARWTVLRNFDQILNTFPQPGEGIIASLIVIISRDENWKKHPGVLEGLDSSVLVDIVQCWTKRFVNWEGRRGAVQRTGMILHANWHTQHNLAWVKTSCT